MRLIDSIIYAMAECSCVFRTPTSCCRNVTLSRKLSTVCVKFLTPVHSLRNLRGTCGWPVRILFDRKKIEWRHPTRLLHYMAARKFNINNINVKYVYIFADICWTSVRHRCIPRWVFDCARTRLYTVRYMFLDIGLDSCVHICIYMYITRFVFFSLFVKRALV